MTTEQTATVRFDIDGRPAPYTRLETVPPCGARVIGVHVLPDFPADANFGVTVSWPQEGSALLIMRSLLSFWSPSTTLIPPVDRVR